MQGVGRADAVIAKIVHKWTGLRTLSAHDETQTCRQNDWIGRSDGFCRGRPAPTAIAATAATAMMRSLLEAAATSKGPICAVGSRARHDG